jgi:hypothetical protein
VNMCQIFAFYREDTGMSLNNTVFCPLPKKCTISYVCHLPHAMFTRTAIIADIQMLRPMYAYMTKEEAWYLRAV